ncbi:MAG: polysaccharide deacetylase family protein [Alcanivoracaceae bacterium]
MRALLSIHDVMPSSRGAIAELLAQLYVSVPALRPQDITLLVVPGAQWREDDLLWLHRLVQAGHPLAGHGWCHRAPERRTLSHHLHSLLLSRDAAEHLSRPESELVALMLRCHAWFEQHELPLGPLYVPPAWAVGKLRANTLAAMPFRLLENLSGVMSLRHGSSIRLPLAGYEADTAWRAAFLSVSNAIHFRAAILLDRPIRIGLHPFDLRYRLGNQLLDDLRRVTQFCGYASAIPDPHIVGMNAKNTASAELKTDPSKIVGKAVQ